MRLILRSNCGLCTTHRCILDRALISPGGGQPVDLAEPGGALKLHDPPGAGVLLRVVEHGVPAHLRLGVPVDGQPVPPQPLRHVVVLASKNTIFGGR